MLSENAAVRLAEKILLPQQGPDQLHPATLQQHLVALEQAWQQRDNKKKEHFLEAAQD